MKRLLLFTILSIVCIHPMWAQNAIAKIKYEQAEEAFLKNEYRTTLAKLDEAQKILGASNPKILYLRLMADKGIIASDKYDYNFLTAVRKDADFYIKKYSEVEGIEDKFREVYDFSEALEKLPQTKAAFEQREAEAARKWAEWVKARPIQVSDSLIKAFGVKRCTTVKEFQAYNPGAFAGLTKYKAKLPPGITLIYNNGFNYSSAGPSNVYFNDKGLFLYSYVIQGDTDSATAKKVYQSLVDLYPNGMDTTTAQRQEITKGDGYESGSLTVWPAATGNRGNIMIMYMFFNVTGKGRVEIYFHPQ